MNRSKLSQKARQEIAEMFTGELQVTESAPGDVRVSMANTIIEIGQLSAIVPGVGRIDSSLLGSPSHGFIPVMSGISSVPVAVAEGGSGIYLPEDGTYIVTGSISASGQTGAIFTTQILLDGVSLQSSVRGTYNSTILTSSKSPVDGFFTAASGTLFQVALSSSNNVVYGAGVEDVAVEGDAGQKHLTLSLIKMPTTFRHNF
jgi:hypothetical protein